MSGKKFTVNLQDLKQKFFRSLNAIFGKVGCKTSPLVLSSLIETQCVPILLYARECFLWKQSMYASIENAYSQAFMKIFNTFDKKIVLQCEYFMGVLPIELKLVLKQLKFLFDLKYINNSVIFILHKNSLDYSNLIAKYCKSLIDNKTNRLPSWRSAIWEYFQGSLDLV